MKPFYDIGWAGRNIQPDDENFVAQTFSQEDDVVAVESYEKRMEITKYLFNTDHRTDKENLNETNKDKKPKKDFLEDLYQVVNF